LKSKNQTKPKPKKPEKKTEANRAKTKPNQKNQAQNRKKPSPKLKNRAKLVFVLKNRIETG
jgi:hypothetical protein